ncbi:hypothetical protein Tco_1082525, partial [Tanacetum coccineum]
MIPGAVTTEEKTQKKNDVKSKSMLLMALPNEHLVTFNQYKDAKILFDAIQTRFGGNDAIKKTQKTLLKQMYKNFNAPSTKSLDSIFNRLQKIQDLEQIYKDDLEAMDLNGKLSLLNLEFKSYGSKDSKLESNIVCDKKLDDSKENSYDSLVKEQVSKDTSSFVESSLNVEKETVFLDKKIEFVKPKNHEKPVKKSVRYAEMYRLQSPRGNQRNWNGQKSNQLGSDFVMYNKACFIRRSFDHVQAQCKYHQRERMVYGNNYHRVNYNATTNMTHPNAQRNMVPRAVLMKTGLKSFNTVRTVNTAHPKSTVFSAKLMSLNIAKAQAVETARPKAINTARLNFAVVNAVRVNQANAVKTSACWVWRPTKPDSASITMKKYNYIDARGRSNGCLRYMTGNIAYLSDFKEFDRGYVTFRGGAHGGRISGKGTLKT